ncbi:MAG: YIP1 family protein [Methanophagales archaeon]|nr:YIP1 family protein [Methanophagales archaeon]MCW3137644.1 YIP1 family protein [Methanophagales archaeon]
MLEVLTNPNKFFETRKKGRENLKIPVFIVLISGIIGGISAFLSSSIMMEAMAKTLPPEAQGFMSFMPISTAIGAVIFSFIIWLIVAAVFFGISCIFKGEGNFKRTLEFVGYGYIPTIIGGLISLVLVYNFITTVQIPAITTTDPTKIKEVIAPLMKSPMMMLSSAVGMLFMLWSANIWVFGLKHARNLSTKNALITVAIPVAAYILYSVYRMLGW